MLNVNNISVFFGGKPIFENVSFQVQSKDRIGLIGKNGAGKSTLLKLISGSIKADSGSIDFSTGYKIGILTQDLHLDTSKSVRTSAKEAFSEILEVEAKIEKLNQELVQREDYESDSYAQLLDTINDQYQQLGVMNSSNMEGEIEKVLKGLGFNSEEFDNPLSTFSGGWQMRAELAKILLQQPDLLILDEPTNHLDIDSIIWLEQYFKTYPGAILMVAHDKAFLDNCTNRTIELAFGRAIDYKLPYSQFVVQREDIYEKQLATYKNQQKQIEQQEKFIEKFKAKATKARQAQSKLKQLDKIERVEIVEFDYSDIVIEFSPAPRSGDVALRGTKLEKTFDNLVFADGELYIERGEKVAFVGKNGMGKSTMVKMIMEEIPFNGELKLGHNINVGYFAQQHHSDLDPEKSVFDTIYDIATNEWTNMAKVRGLLGAFLFGAEDIDKKVKVLSGGERARLAMAKLILKPYNMLILDEPTNHLDIHVKEILKNALKKYDGTLIIVSHDRDFLDELTEKTYEFADNKVKEHLGSIKDFLAKYEMEEFRTFELDKGNKELKPSPQSQEKSKIKKIDYQIDRRELKKEVNKLENAISTIEKELEKIHEQMTDPDFYNDPNMTSIIQKQKDLENKLEIVMEEWDHKATLLDDLDKN